MREKAKYGTAGLPREETQRMLELLREGLDNAHDGGENALKLRPEDLRRLCSRAGIGGDAAGAFRSLVRSNLVRLRGRCREGVSGETAPVYVARIASPEPQELRGEDRDAEAREERAASGRSRGGGR